MLSEAAASSARVISNSVFAPVSEVEKEPSDQVIGDLKTCFEKALDRRRVVRDTNEQWHALGVVWPPSGDFSSQYGVRISTVVEERQDDYMPDVASSRKVAGPSRHFYLQKKEKKSVPEPS